MNSTDNMKSRNEIKNLKEEIDTLYSCRKVLIYKIVLQIDHKEDQNS